MASVQQGDRINNYLLEERVGAGSFGEVWRARHHVFGDVVAIKIPTDPQYVRNLQREGVAIHGLQHPNVVRAIDLDPYATPPYFIMEYVDGPSLRGVIDRYKGEFPITAAAVIMRGVLSALGAAHEQDLIHRDVKPANILLRHPLDEIAAITEQAVKVTDFGLGRVGDSTTQSIMQSGSLLTEEGKSIAGTLAYMAPEVKDGEQADPCSDVYSCGIVLFEMLTGTRPQGGDAPSSLRAEVPSHLDEVFRRCYTRRERRYESALAMLTAMAPRADAPPVTPPPVPMYAQAGANGRRCPACQLEVLTEDQFCIRCGQQLAESVPRCGACQAYVNRNDRFCIFCGTDLRVLP